MTSEPFANQRGEELAGRVALVTGSSRNMGRAIALSLAAGGADVAVHARASLDEARSVAADIRQLGRESEAFLADNTEREQIEALVGAVLQRFGKIDILVLNAAVREGGPLSEATYEEWRRILAADLDSAFIYTKACLPSMIEAGGGNIVTFGGASALQGSGSRIHVTSAKHAMVGFTKSAANDLAQFGIRVNMVSPGRIGEESDSGGATTRGASTRSRCTAPARPRRSQPWCASSAGPAPASSPARPSTSTAAR
jgi:3-oxoacyl-[acyl-carrier protein] reductase